MIEGANHPVAIVTGGFQGLGLGAVAELAAEGFLVAVLDLRAPAEVPTDLFPPGTRYYQLDIADLDAHDAVLDRIITDFGRIDCLVNNAGVAARPLTDILELQPEQFDRSVDVNLRGTFFLTQNVANRLVSQGTHEHYASIITITSIAAELVNTQRAQYCVTKAGLSMVTKLYAQRLASLGIACHEIRPGFMHTTMLASVGQTVVDEWIEDGRVPIPRWGSPSDVGRAVATLASGRMPYSTGQAFWVAGGLNIPPAP